MFRFFVHWYAIGHRIRHLSSPTSSLRHQSSYSLFSWFSRLLVKWTEGRRDVLSDHMRSNNASCSSFHKYRVTPLFPSLFLPSPNMPCFVYIIPAILIFSCRLCIRVATYIIRHLRPPSISPNSPRRLAFCTCTQCNTRFALRLVFCVLYISPQSPSILPHPYIRNRPPHRCIALHHHHSSISSLERCSHIHSNTLCCIIPCILSMLPSVSSTLLTIVLTFNRCSCRTFA